MPEDEAICHSAEDLQGHSTEDVLTPDPDAEAEDAKTTKRKRKKKKKPKGEGNDWSLMSCMCVKCTVL